MLPILLTGIATLDIVNQLDHFPLENSEVRALQQNMQVGGNASNSALVLQQLGVDVHLLVNRADDSNAQQIFNELNAHHINTQLCPVQTHSTTPTSYITINTQNGSRSIVHFRDLNELQATDFYHINLCAYRWLHFEARNGSELLLMLEHALKFNLPISLELEKPREHMDALMPYAQLLLISKPFALSRGFKTAMECLKYFSCQFPEKTMTCTWGSKGAWGYADGKTIHQAATPIQNIIETLGAGDTFNAAMINCISKGYALKDALKFSCQLAEKKCLQQGILNLPITQQTQRD